MTNLLANAIALKLMDIENTCGSKVEGKRNWMVQIRTTDNLKVAYVGTHGQMTRRGFNCEMIEDIVKYSIRWFFFTYKKDLLNTLKTLEESGYSVQWLQ